MYEQRFGVRAEGGDVREADRYAAGQRNRYAAGGSAEPLRGGSAEPLRGQRPLSV